METIPLPPVETGPSASISQMQNHYLIDKITKTDIQRLNGYLSIVNIVGSIVYILCGIAAFFTPHSYSEFIIAVDIIFIGFLFLLFEFRDRVSPTLSNMAKINLGFIFTAAGRAMLMILMALLIFSQGTFGIFVGFLYLALAALNFVIIYKHPGYKEAVTEEELALTKESPVGETVVSAHVMV